MRPRTAAPGRSDPGRLDRLKAEDVLALAQADTQLRRAGIYWIGPCPFCGGHDRFVIKTSTNSWFCRHCSDGKYRDAVDYMATRLGLTSADFLRGDKGAPVQVSKSLETPTEPKADMRCWCEAAGNFVLECETRLWSDDGAQARAWLQVTRGLSEMSLRDWRLGWNPEDRCGDPMLWGTADPTVLPRGITIPCWPDRLRYVKVRRGANATPKYQQVTGGTGWLFGVETLAGAMQAFVFESELDVILGVQEWGGPGLGFCSFPAGGTWSPAWTGDGAGIERFLLALDNDESGQKAAAKLAELTPRMVRVSYPEGVKDLGDLRQHGGNVNDWIYEALA